MDTAERDNLIHRIGTDLAAGLKEFYGSVRINIQNGRYVNANLEQSLKPEPRREKE